MLASLRRFLDDRRLRRDKINEIQYRQTVVSEASAPVSDTLGFIIGYETGVPVTMTPEAMLGAVMHNSSHDYTSSSYDSGSSSSSYDSGSSNSSSSGE
jgi:hypothetical protein